MTIAVVGASALTRATMVDICRHPGIRCLVVQHAATGLLARTFAPTAAPQQERR